MGAAAFWSFVGASALVLGALAGLYLAVTSRIVGLVMGFGAGTLIAAVAYDLVAEAFAEGGRLSTIMGLSAGALLFWGGDWLLERRTGGDDPVVEATVSGPSLLANTMFPDAYRNGGREVGLVTVLGFIAASGLAVASV